MLRVLALSVGFTAAIVGVVVLAYVSVPLAGALAFGTFCAAGAAFDA